MSKVSASLTNWNTSKASFATFMRSFVSRISIITRLIEFCSAADMAREEKGTDFKVEN